MNLPADRSNTDDAGRDDLLQRLGRAMSDLQEACFHAGWMSDVALTIVAKCRAAILTGKPQKWGIGELSVASAQEMWSIAMRLDGWAEWEDFDRYRVDYPFTALDATPPEGERAD